MTHSPTPWTITEDKTSSFGPSYTVRDAKGKWLLNDTLYYPSAFSREDADFIVRAVNAHDDLVAALTDMLSGWHYIRSHHGDLYGVGWDRAQQAAEAALSKAKEAL